MGKLKISITGNAFLPIFKPTSVFVVDLCFIFNNVPQSLNKDVVDKMIKDINQNKLERKGIIEYEGAKIVYTKTAYGNGFYYADTSLPKRGNGFMVSNGIIGLLTLDDLKNIDPNFNNWDIGVIIENFEGVLSADENGNVFGSNNKNKTLEIWTEGSQENKPEYFENNDEFLN